MPCGASRFTAAVSYLPGEWDLGTDRRHVCSTAGGRGRYLRVHSHKLHGNLSTGNDVWATPHAGDKASVVVCLCFFSACMPERQPWFGDNGLVLRLTTTINMD